MKGLINKDKLILIAFLFTFISFWFLLPDYAINIISLSFCNGLVILGLLLLMRAGLISFGHGMYYCLGGYAVAMTYYFLQIKEVFILIFFAVSAGFILSFLLTTYFTSLPSCISFFCPEIPSYSSHAELKTSII